MKKRILITAIGGDISQSVATILREAYPDVFLIGTDVHFQHGGRLFVNCLELVPIASDQNYLSALKALIIKYDINIIIPMSEPELRSLYPFDDLLFGAKFITSGLQVVAAGIDKLSTFQALENLDLPVPWTVHASKSDPISYPCILKNRYGSGSRNIFNIINYEDMIYFRERYPDAIFQEMLEPADKEITCAVYRKSDGDISVLLMLRRLTGGFTSWAKIIDNDKALKMCVRIAEGLNLRGSMNVQLRLTKIGPRVFEINPRFSSTILMRHRIGFTDVLWAIDEADGKLIKYPKIETNKIMVRIQGASIFDDERTGELK